MAWSWLTVFSLCSLPHDSGLQEYTDQFVSRYRLNSGKTLLLLSWSFQRIVNFVDCIFPFSIMLCHVWHFSSTIVILSYATFSKEMQEMDKIVVREWPVESQGGGGRMLGSPPQCEYCLCTVLEWLNAALIIYLWFWYQPNGPKWSWKHSFFKVVRCHFFPPKS